MNPLQRTYSGYATDVPNVPDAAGVTNVSIEQVAMDSYDVTNIHSA